MNSLPPDPWKVLGVTKETDKSEIRKAWKKLALTSHPDKVQDPALKAEKQAEFQRVQEAWELLNDEKELARYEEKVQLRELRAKMATMKQTVPQSWGPDWNKGYDLPSRPAPPRAHTFPVNYSVSTPRKDRKERLSPSRRDRDREIRDQEREVEAAVIRREQQKKAEKREIEKAERKEQEKAERREQERKDREKAEKREREKKDQRTATKEALKQTKAAVSREKAEQERRSSSKFKPYIEDYEDEAGHPRGRLSRSPEREEIRYESPPPRERSRRREKSQSQSLRRETSRTAPGKTSRAPQESKPIPTLRKNSSGSSDANAQSALEYMMRQGTNLPPELTKPIIAQAAMQSGGGSSGSDGERKPREKMPPPNSSKAHHVPKTSPPMREPVIMSAEPRHRPPRRYTSTTTRDYSSHHEPSYVYTETYPETSRRQTSSYANVYDSRHEANVVEPEYRPSAMSSPHSASGRYFPKIKPTWNTRHLSTFLTSRCLVHVGLASLGFRSRIF